MQQLPIAEVTKTFRFESSHQLYGHNGKCARVHGHSYIVELTLRGNLIQEGSSEGMVVDFGDIKHVWFKLIDSVLDHAHLNDVLPVRSTAENMCFWILNRLKQMSHLPVHKIRLWETASGSATIWIGDQVGVEFPYLTKKELEEEPI